MLVLKRLDDVKMLEVCMCDIRQLQLQGWVGLKEDLVAVAFEDKMRTVGLKVNDVSVLAEGLGKPCECCGSPVLAFIYHLNQ